MKLLVKNTSTYHFWWHPYLISTPSVQICNWRKSQLFHILLITPLNIVSKMFLTAANCIWREPNFHIVMNVSGDLSDCHNKQFISFLSSWCWHKRLQCCQMMFFVWWPRIPTSKGGRWPRKGCPCYYNIWCYYKYIMLYGRRKCIPSSYGRHFFGYDCMCDRRPL